MDGSLGVLRALGEEEVLGKFLGVFWFVSEVDDVGAGWKRLCSVRWLSHALCIPNHGHQVWEYPLSANDGYDGVTTLSL
jgi:hypothetical protein